MRDFFYALILIVLLVLVLMFTRWVFEATMASDLPGWLKYMILR